MSTLVRLLQFARERVGETPVRLHQRALADDGSPQWSHEFDVWMTSSPFALKVQESVEPCTHEDQTGCESCAVFAADGSVLVSTGQRVRRSWVYKRPDAAALRRLSKLPVQFGYPRMDQVVILATLRGFSPATLAEQFPALPDEAAAERLMVAALRKFRSLYTVEPPVRLHRRLVPDD